MAWCCVETFVAEVDGGEVFCHEGEVYADGHPVVAANPSAFVPADTVIEAVKAAPARRRASR